MKVLRELAHEAATCAYCPKLCRFACPVAEAEKRETVTPWGKVTLAYWVEQGHREPDATLLAAANACTGCMRCRTFCEHGQEVGEILVHARAAARAFGVTHPGVDALLVRFEAAGSPHGGDLAGAAAALGRPAAPGAPALFPGCTALSVGATSPKSALAAAEALGAPLALSTGAGACCGYPLWAAGALDQFAAHARTFAERAGDGQQVCVDPACAYTLRVLYPRVGVPALDAVHASTYLAAKLSAAPELPPLGGRAAYHDPCHLGRGLGEYEAPRRLLRAAGVQVAEPEWAREEGGCCGGGGLLPVTMPGAADEIARRRAEELALEAPRAATVCPTAAARLGKAGLPTDDVLDMFARWLGQRGSRA